MSTDINNATDTKHTLPRSAGKRRPASAVQPDWWIHLQADTEQALEPDGWEQVDYVIEAAGICVIRFIGYEDEVTVPSRGEIVTLTAAEARRHGLGAEG